MQIGSLSTEQAVVVVAEIGNNHEGSYSLALEMISAAREAGAHAVKFQTYKTELFIGPSEEARVKRLKGFELSYGDFEKLAQHAQSEGIIFFSTPLDLESARFLASISPVIKIASGDNNFYPLLEVASESGKPVIFSTGLADLHQIHITKGFLEEAWRRRGISQEMAILHCVTDYPVAPAEANVSAITELRREFDCTIGYSDHTLGSHACFAAVALGARIIEKHFTLDKNQSDFRDHKISADPAELRELVSGIAEIQVLLGSGKKEVQPGEAQLKGAVRRAICASRDLPAGTVLTTSDLVWLRPSGPLSPGEEELLLGKSLSRTMRRGEPFSPLDVV